MFHICHEEIFALMQMLPFVSTYAAKLRALFHKDRPHPTCNDKHLTETDPHLSGVGCVNYKCSCGTAFTASFRSDHNYQGQNIIHDPEINSDRPQCPNCGATT